MRCLALASALSSSCTDVTFVSAEMHSSLAARIAASGARLVMIDPAIPGATEMGWEAVPWPLAAQHSDALQSRRALGDRPCDVMFVDHYLLDHVWEGEMRANCVLIVAIDDLASREHVSDALLDQTLGRCPADYSGLIPDGCDLWLGAQFALLRTDFAALRPQALVRRAEPAPARRLLVMTGSQDLGGSTGVIVDRVVASGFDGRVDVVIGQDAPSYQRVRRIARRHSEFAVHSDVADIATMMLNADLCIGAAGTATWERCALGLPVLQLVLAVNQRTIARSLEEAGAGLTLPGPDCEDMVRMLNMMWTDPPRLHAMSRAAFMVTDGLGAGRVAEGVKNAVKRRALP